MLKNHCLLCDLTCKFDTFICDQCRQTLPRHTPGCVGCGVNIHLKHENNLCGQCISTPPAFHQLFSLFDYAEPISSFIHQLKFQGNLRIARWFATEWIHFLKNAISLPEVIFPVPLHHARLSERGFNQANEIAKPIGNYFNIPIDTKACVRIKNTQAQSALSSAKRKNNVKNAFGLSRTITEKHVVILDDVVTTGNTVTELVLLLRKMGVQKIDVWCVARAITSRNSMILFPSAEQPAPLLYQPEIN